MKIYQKFLEMVEKYPTHPCVSDIGENIEQTTLTYTEMQQKIFNLTEKLHDFKNTCAVIYLPKSHHIVMWQLALNACGVAFLNVEHGDEPRLKSALERCEPSLLICENGVKFLSQERYYHCSYIVFSSGSTGLPKKILLDDAGLVEVVLEQAKITRMNAEQSSLWLLNPAFDASLSDIYMTLLSGGHLFISDKKPSDLHTIARIISCYNISHTDIPPVVFPLWLRHVRKNPDMFNSLRCIIFGGEKASSYHAQALAENFSLYNAYGPSESTICSSMVQIDKNWIAEDIGRPLAGIEYRVWDGVLHIGGHCALGYDDPLLDKRFYEKDGKRWFISGDIVQYNGSTYFYRGRKDRQFKYHGQLICPEEIEGAALLCGCDSARVYYRQKITLKYTGEIEENDLKRCLRNYLPSSMIPHFVEKTVLQLSPHWKVQ